jgi:hypothetical protein
MMAVMHKSDGQNVDGRFDAGVVRLLVEAKADACVICADIAEDEEGMEVER